MRDRRLERQFLRWRDRGDVDALTRVFDATAPGLLSLASHLVREADQAEDLVQATFLAAIEAAASYEGGRALYPWLAGILIRKSRRWNRDAARAVDPERLPERSALGPADDARATELRGELERALGQLRPPYREVLREYLEEGRKPREIAAAHGLAPGTVRVRIHRALDHLRKVLPSGLALGAALHVAPRGLAAVRAEVARAAVAGATGHAAAAIVPTSIPLAVMSTKTIAAAGAALLAIGLWATRTPDQPTDAALDPAPVAEEGGGTSASPLVGSGADAREIAGAPAPGVSAEPESPRDVPTAAIEPRRAAATGVWLVGTCKGLDDFPSEGVRLHLRDLSVGLGEGDVLWDDRERLEVDLSDWANPDDTLPDGIWIEAKVEGYLPLVGLGQLAKPRPAPGRVEYRTELSFVRMNVSIRGRAVVPDGVDATKVKVAFRYDGDEVRPVQSAGEIAFDEALETARELSEQPVAGDEEPFLVDVEVFEMEHATLERIDFCAADGSFRLELPRAAPGCFVVYSWHARPWNTRVTFEDAPEVDVGEVVFDGGTEIAGTAWFLGRPVPEGSWISLRRLDDLDPQNYDTLRFEDWSFEHCQMFDHADRDGGFRFGGLVSGASYVLKVMPLEVDGVAHAFADIAGVHEVVVAPSPRVRLECPLVPREVVLLSDGRPVASASIRRYAPDGGPLRGEPEPWFSMMEAMGEIADAEGVVRFLAHPTDPFLLKAGALGYETIERVVALSDFDVDGRLFVELEPLTGKDTVEFRLLDDPETLEGTPVALDLSGNAFPVGHHASARVADGRLVFEGVPEGHLQADFRPESDPALAPDEQSWLAPLRTVVPVERDGPIDVNVRYGGRVRLELRGWNGEGPAPRFQLLDENNWGTAFEWMLASRSGTRVADGPRAGEPAWIGPALRPGHYRLKQIGEGFAEGVIELDVEVGRTTSATFQLVPR